MIENRNESELEAHLRRVVKHSGNLSGLKSDRGNEKTGLRMVSNTLSRYTITHTLAAILFGSYQEKVNNLHIR